MVGRVTVAEFIVWLQTQDQGAEIEILKGTVGHGWDSCDYYEFVPFTSELTAYTDFRSNEFVKPDAPYYDKRFLYLGEKA